MFESFDLMLQPRRLKIPNRVRASLHNKGNAQSEFSVVGRDPNEKIKFHGERGRISLSLKSRPESEQRPKGKQSLRKPKPDRGKKGGKKAGGKRERQPFNNPFGELLRKR